MYMHMGTPDCVGHSDEACPTRFVKKVTLWLAFSEQSVGLLLDGSTVLFFSRLVGVSRICHCFHVDCAAL